MKCFVFMISIVFGLLLQGRAQHKIDFNKEYKNTSVTKASALAYTFPLEKDGIYQFSILQQGIAIHYALIAPDNKKVYECNYPEDIVGYEKFEYTPSNSGDFTLAIKRFNDPQNTDSGSITLFIKKFSKSELEVRKQIKKELEPENKKNVTTIDIDHFWEAFDNLKKCKTYSDSVNSFQRLYLDKATNGLLDFIQVREFTADKFVEAVAKNNAFYQSVRNNTIVAKKAEPAVEEVFSKFKELYSDFKPFKVCFAIGIKNTGGTVSNQFVLIGTEVTTSSKGTDTVKGDDLIQKIKGIVAHECVHTQQKTSQDPGAIKCPLLYQSVREGSCDFIAELITGRSRSSEYGEKNEKRLWTEFKNEFCSQNYNNWLYNSSMVKSKPADLGYYIGYEITKEYYKNASEKKQAIVDIIGMSNAIRFLEESKYDQKIKK